MHDVPHERSSAAISAGATRGGACVLREVTAVIAVGQTADCWMTRVGKYVFTANTGSGTVSRLIGTGNHGGTRVSLLVTAGDGSAQLALPAEVLPHVTSAGRVDDMSVVSFRTSRHMVFVVGDVAQADLVKLADAVSGPLYRGLAGA